MCMYVYIHIINNIDIIKRRRRRSIERILCVLNELILNWIKNIVNNLEETDCKQNNK